MPPSIAKKKKYWRDSMKRREFIKKSISTAAVTGLAGFTTHLFTQKTEDVRIGYLPITDATPLLVAHGNGYYKEEGLNANNPTLIRSWSALVESFLSGKFNVVHLLLPIPIWMRYRNRSGVKIVAWDHLNGSALTVGNNMGINGFGDLGGKRIAVPYWYSMHNVILQMGLKKMGLKPVIRPRSYQLKPDETNLFLLAPPEMPPALAARKIDGYIVAEPFNALGELKIKAKIMRFTGDIWKNHPCCVVVMKEDLIRSNPVFTQKVVNAVVKAQQYVLGHPKETAKLLSKDGKRYLPMNEETLLRVFTHYDPAVYGKGNAGNLPEAIKHPDWNVQRIGFQPYPYPSATHFIYKQLRETLVQGDNSFLQKVSPDFVVKDLVAYDFVKKAVMAQGGPGKFTDMNIQSPWDREEVIEI
ncbi:MAG: ABC transporter substrate-binding protein [bacterium]|nr:ABC transporter substrate-binding protein [bacterium]